MVPEDDPFYQNLQTILGANFPPSICKSSRHRSAVGPTNSPLSFYDRHISSTLCLKRITPLAASDLARNLSQLLDNKLKDFVEKGHRFPAYADMDPHLPDDSYWNAPSHGLLNYYMLHVGILANFVASRILLYPEQPQWESLFALYSRGEMDSTDFVSEMWLSVAYNLDSKSFTPSTKFLDGLDQSIKDKAKTLAEKYDHLATWHIFSLCESATNMFRTLVDDCNFEWELPRTSGSALLPFQTAPIDAEATLKTLLPTERVHIQGVNVGNAAMHSGTPDSNNTSPLLISKSVVPLSIAPRKRPERLEFRHYIQKVCVVLHLSILGSCFYRHG